MIPVSFDITLFIVAVLGAVVAVGMALLRQVLVISGRARVAAAEARNAQLRKRQEQSTDQYRRFQDRLRDAEVEVKSMHTQILEVQRRIRLAKADSYVVVHELGEPGGRKRLFTGSLGLGALLSINQSTAKDSLLRGARHQVEVWATGDAEAAELARRAFPAEGGFLVSKLVSGTAPPATPSPARAKPLSRAVAG